MWAYDLMEVRPHLEYIARNIKFQSKEKWCKNEFVISMSETTDEFRSVEHLSTMECFAAMHLRS